jgi:hypothetical protein
MNRGFRSRPGFGYVRTMAERSSREAFYSPLDEIDTENVEDLKGVWMTDLRGSGAAAKYSAEAQPIVYVRVIYAPTGEDHVFAVSVETGDILWEYEGNLGGAGLARVAFRDGDVGDREPQLWSVVTAVCGRRTTASETASAATMTGMLRRTVRGRYGVLSPRPTALSGRKSDVIQREFSRSDLQQINS